MRAAIVEHMNAPIEIADDDHVPPPQPRREEVARDGHLAFVTDIQPGMREQAVHLELEDRRV
jgi:hypothetical protein